MGHTKGPWAYEIEEDLITISSLEGVEIATCPHTQDMGSDDCANAALLSAAPEMLAALEEAACWVPDGSRMTPAERGAKCETAYEVQYMIDAAIARAKGGQ